VADQLGYSGTYVNSRPKPAATAADAKAAAKKPQKSLPPNAYFGLLRAPGYTPKPSYFAYQTLCALFDSQTEAAETPMHFAGDFTGAEPAISAERIEQAGFVRGQSPLVAYWFPADVFQDMPARPVDMTLAVKAGLKLADPVLVDPMSGQVFKLEGKQSGQQWQFASLPLTDYPMLVTDKSVVSGKS